MGLMWPRSRGGTRAPGSNAVRLAWLFAVGICLSRRARKARLVLYSELVLSSLVSLGARI